MAGAVPASVLARHHHHKGHHHAKPHIRRFGDPGQPTSMSSSDNAGKVESFSNGILTITLNDGSMVKGAVTKDTELECTTTQQSSTTHDDGDNDQAEANEPGDNDQAEANEPGDNDQGEANEPGDNDQAEANEPGDNDQGEDEQNECSTSNLTPGAVVHEAVLRIGGSGAVWQQVELVL
jgi:hypothetical protein